MVVFSPGFILWYWLERTSYDLFGVNWDIKP